MFSRDWPASSNRIAAWLRFQPKMSVSSLLSLINKIQLVAGHSGQTLAGRKEADGLRVATCCSFPIAALLSQSQRAAGVQIDKQQLSESRRPDASLSLARLGEVSLLARRTLCLCGGRPNLHPASRSISFGLSPLL